MKLKICLAGLAAAVLISACNMGGSYHTTFYSAASFEFYSNLASQLAHNGCRDSLITLETPFYGATGLIVKNAKTAGTLVTEPGFIVSMQKDKGQGADYATRPFASFSTQYAGYKTFAFGVYADIRGAVPSKTHTVTFDSPDTGTADLLGYYVNNTNEIVNLVKYGSEARGIPPFAPGDKLTLTLTAYPATATNAGSSAPITREVVLAERTESDLKLVSDWQEVKIDNMKNFLYLDFAVTSNRTDIPLNVCIDHLTAFIEIGEK